MQRGGNSRFYNFEKGYDINEIPIVVKYRTKAMDYYRKLLKSEVECETPPLVIRKNEAKLVLLDQDNQKD